MVERQCEAGISRGPSVAIEIGPRRPLSDTRVEVLGHTKAGIEPRPLQLRHQYGTQILEDRRNIDDDLEPLPVLGPITILPAPTLAGEDFGGSRQIMLSNGMLFERSCTLSKQGRRGG